MDKRMYHYATVSKALEELKEKIKTDNVPDWFIMMA